MDGVWWCAILTGSDVCGGGIDYCLPMCAGFSDANVSDGHYRVRGTKGVLFKDAEAIEALSKVNTLIVDKTGTLTEGKEP